MVDDIDETEEEARRKKKKDEGEGDSDSWGRGKAGAAAGGIRLPPQKLQEVMSNWRHLDVNAVVAALAEFFSELPMRASANLKVDWDKSRSFAIVNWAIEAGHKLARELSKTRERVRGAGRDTRGLQQRKPRGNTPKMGGPSGPSGQ